VGISGGTTTQGRMGCYCHPVLTDLFLKTSTAFSGNLLCCFATLTLHKFFPLMLKTCFIPYKHAGQNFPFLFAAAINTDSFFHPLAFFLRLRNPNAFALPSEVLFLPALLLAAP